MSWDLMLGWEFHFQRDYRQNGSYSGGQTGKYWDSAMYVSEEERLELSKGVPSTVQDLSRRKKIRILLRLQGVNVGPETHFSSTSRSIRAVRAVLSHEFPNTTYI